MEKLVRGSFVPLLGLVLLLSGCQHSAQSYFDRGERLFAEGKFEEATINYENAIKKDAKFVEAYHKLGLCAFSQGNLGVALAAVSFAHQLAPLNRKIAEDLADFTFQRYLTSGHSQYLYDQTNLLVKDILDKDAASATALRLRASLLYGDGKLREAIAAYRTVNASHPYDPAIVLPLADALRLSGEGAEAERLGLDLIEHKQDFAPAYDWLAQLYSSTGRVSETEKILRLRMTRNPKDLQAVVALARFLRSDRREKEAHDLLEGFIARPGAPDRYLVAGDFYGSSRDWAAAERSYRTGITAEPSAKARYLTKLAVLYLAQNRSEEALKASEEAVAVESFNPEAQTIRLAILTGSGDRAKVSKAISLAQDLMKKWPKDGRYPAALAAAYRAQGDEKAASSHYEEATRLDHDLVEPRIALAEFSRQKRDVDGVFRYSEEVLTVDPRNIQARLLHAWGWISRRDFNTADAEMKTLMTDAPDSEDVRFQAALLYIEEKKTGMAVDLLAGLLRSRPGDQRLLAALATAYVQGRSYDAAIKMVASEVQKDPSSQAKRTLLANLAEKLGVLDLALENFRMLSQASPASGDYIFEIGKIYEAMGNKSEAIANFEKAVRLDAGDATKQGRLAMAYYSAGRVKEADSVSELSVKLSPADPVLLNNRAYILAETGSNPDEGIRLVQAALARNPDDPALSDTLAFCYIKKQLGDNATAILNRIVASNPDEAMFRYHLAMALILKGDKTGARRELETSLRKRVSREDQARIRELLSTLA